MKSFCTAMRTLYLFVAVTTMQMASCDGATIKKVKPTKTTEPLKDKTINQRHRRNMSKPTVTPTAAPVTPLPTATPTTPPTEDPTFFPTAYPTEKKSMERSPQVAVAPVSIPMAAVVPTPVTQTFTNAPIFPTPVANPPIATNPPLASPQATNPPVALPVTNVPEVVVTELPTVEPTIEPTTEPTAEPTILPSGMPMDLPSGQPSNEPSAEPSGSPIVSTNVPTAFPTVAPTYSNSTSQMALRDFSILLLSFDTSAINVGLVESTLEQYFNRTMVLEHLMDVSLIPVTASSAQGSNFTATSIRFAGTASFVIEVPTQESLSLTQDGVILSSISIPNIQKAITNNTSLSLVRAVSISYDELDPKSIVDTVPASTGTGAVKDTTGSKDSNSEASGKDNGGLVIGLVLTFSFLVVGGALYVIRRRRGAHGTDSSNATKPVSARKMGDSYYPALRNQYPDIEKPKEESVNTPNEEDDESSAADLSSYMMTPSGSLATEVRGSTTILKNQDKINDSTVIRTTSLNTNETQIRPTVEISVSHITDVADDEDYTSTDDGSAKFGATDMSECTFRG